MFHTKYKYFAEFFYYFSAGIGVLNALRKTMARMLGNNESAFESARSQFWVVDAEVSSNSQILSSATLLWGDKSYILIADTVRLRYGNWPGQFDRNKLSAQQLAGLLNRTARSPINGEYVIIIYTEANNHITFKFLGARV
jgi:hypothetical protein